MKTRIDFLSDYEVAKSDCRKFTKWRGKTKKAVIVLKFCVTSVLHLVYIHNTQKHKHTQEDLKQLAMTDW